jgi:hypothetical protein
MLDNRCNYEYVKPHKGLNSLFAGNNIAFFERKIIRFEVFTAVVIKSIIFWDMTPCSPLSFKRSFGGTYRLHLQGRKISSAKTIKQLAISLLAGFC